MSVKNKSFLIGIEFLLIIKKIYECGKKIMKRKVGKNNCFPISLQKMRINGTFCEKTKNKN